MVLVESISADKGNIQLTLHTRVKAVASSADKMICRSSCQNFLVDTWLFLLFGVLDGLFSRGRW